MLLSTHVKFAPFATKQRRGYLRDATERDLAVLLETALRGVLINDRWPKSGVEVIVTVLEGEDDGSLDIYALEHQHQTQDRSTNSAIMTVLSGCITVASAAIIDAGIDCVGVVSGGTAALVKGSPHSSQPSLTTQINGADYHVLLDPSASDNDEIVATCVVGYMKTRDEITEVWITGDVPTQSQANPSSDTLVEFLIEGAARAASATHLVIADLFKDLK